MEKINFKMVKKTMQTKKRASRRQVFGPVSTINTAPVAIGNSLRGSKPAVVHTKDGARVMGRDFAFAAVGTNSLVTGWELIGGMPITPAVLASSTLRNFNQIYNKFKFHKMNIHYITSSPTSQAGDVLFYYEKSRLEPSVDYSNSSFLNFVMSDVRTVIGPQWANHTASIVFTDDFKSTGYGATIDGDDDTQGSIYLYSKTNATNSPGYILIDYDVSFKELSISPRAGIFPCVRGLFTNVVFGPSGGLVSTTAGTTTVSGLVTTAGKLLDGTSTTSNPVGLLPGDVFKCMLCATASASGVVNNWTSSGFTMSTLLANADAVDTALSLDDGFTFYAKYSDTTVDASSNPVWSFHSTAAGAVNNSRTFVYASTQTSKSFYLNCWVSLYTSTASGFIQNAY